MTKNDNAYTDQKTLVRFLKPGDVVSIFHADVDLGKALHPDDWWTPWEKLTKFGTSLPRRATRESMYYEHGTRLLIIDNSRINPKSYFGDGGLTAMDPDGDIVYMKYEECGQLDGWMLSLGQD